jgi:phosphate starvation-inducible PhoH-like protein
VSTSKRLTKKEKRILRQNGELEEIDKPSFTSPNFKLANIQPATENQRKTFEAFAEGKHLMLHGMAGTGKTFVSMYLALQELMDGVCNQNKIYLIRSVVPTRDMGFLPGNQKEKMKVYEAPYSSICTELYRRGDAYEVLKQKGAIEFISTSFIRGITLNDCYVIVDEINNMTFHELDSVITRIGKNCRVVFCGDFRQSDLTRDQERNGLQDFIKIINRLSDFEHIEFQEKDIVRSKLVKEYIIAREKLGLQA